MSLWKYSWSIDTNYVHCLLYFVIISLGILTLCKFSSSFEYVKCLSTLVTERFKKWQMSWISWFWDGFVGHCQRNWILIKLNEHHKWNFFRDGNLLVGVVGMFSWFKYSGCIGLLTQNTKKWQIVINKKRKKSTGCFFLVLL